MRFVPVLLLVTAACAADPGADAVAPALTDLDAAQHVAEGEQLWRASCPVPGEADLCLERVAVAGTGRCGSPPATRMVVRTREAESHAAAREHFLRAANLARAEQPLTPETARAGTRALFLLGEEAAEQLIAHEFPTGLDFATAEDDSRVRFDYFLRYSNQDLRAAMTAYLESIGLGGSDPIAATLRVAQLYEHYAREVGFAPIPVDVAPFADATLAYCDALADESLKLLAKADEARAYCREVWQALPEDHRPPSDPCGAELEPRADLAAVQARARR